MTNRASILSDIATDFADNTSGNITPALLRTVTNEMINTSVTLPDNDTISGIKTFSATPIISTLTGVVVANGASALTALSTAGLQAQVAVSYISFTATSVNFNSLADTAVTITLPTGYTRYKIQEVIVSNASISLTTAQFGLYTAPAQGGANIVAQTVTSITTNVTATNHNAYTATIINQGTTFYTTSTLYFNIGTAQGAAATADVTIKISPLP